MKKTIKSTILTLIAVMVFTSATTVSASSIPREAVPDGTPLTAITVTEELVGDVLTKVQSGTGYAVAKAEAIMMNGCKAFMRDIHRRISSDMQ